MTRFFSTLAVSFSLLALAGIVFALMNDRAGPGTSVDVSRLARVHARQNDLEERLREFRIGSALQTTSLGSDESPPGNAETTGGENSPATIEALLSRLEILETRLRALEGGPVHRALTYLESDDAELRKRGVHSLKSLAGSDPEARAALHDMLNDPDAGVRIAALRALSEVGDEESAALAASLLDDEDGETRREAIKTLMRLGAKGAGAEIAALIDDENDEVRRLAVDSMGRLGYKDSSAELLSALEDPNVGVRGEAISSLGEIGATESISQLRDLYADQMEGAHKEADHRVQLAMALKQLGDPEAMQSEIARLGDLIHYSDNGGAMRALMWIGRDEPQAREIFQRAAEVSQTEWIRREAQRILSGDGEDARE